MPTFVGILTFVSWKNSILGLSDPKKGRFLDIFLIMSIYNFMLKHEKKLITSGPGSVVTDLLSCSNQLSMKTISHTKDSPCILQRFLVFPMVAFHISFVFENSEQALFSNLAPRL